MASAPRNCSSEPIDSTPTSKAMPARPAPSPSHWAPTSRSSSSTRGAKAATKIGAGEIRIAVRPTGTTFSP
jgi:hypothetical protein